MTLIREIESPTATCFLEAYNINTGRTKQIRFRHRLDPNDYQASIDSISITPQIIFVRIEIKKGTNCFETGDHPQTINGLDIENIGVAFFLPLAGGNGKNDDSWPEEAMPRQTVNGVVISPGGFGGIGTVVNGLNLSGVNNYTDKVNGLTTGLLLCFNRRVNGLSIGGVFGNISAVVKGVQVGGLMNGSTEMNGLQIGVINEASFLKGLQIGLVNRATSMQGVQIGFINMSGKRTLPFINLGFKKPPRVQTGQ